MSVDPRRKSRTRRLLQWIGLLLATCLISLVSLATCAGGREPIYVSSLEELLAAFPFIGGSGTVNDPFVLTDLVIDANNADYALHLEGLDVPLLLRGLELHSARGPDAMGAISLVNCKQVRIESCTIRDSDIGIRLFNSRDCLITGNVIESNGIGIYLDLLSRENLIYGNCLDNETNARDAGANTWVGPEELGNCWSDLDARLRNGRYPITPRGEDWAPRPLRETCGGSDAGVLSIVLFGDTQQVVECGTLYTDPGYRVHGNVDEGIQVMVDGEVNVREPGTYTIHYSGCDSAGNCAETTRIVDVEDSLPPVFSDACPQIVIIDVGKSADTVVLDAMDQCDGALRIAVNLSQIDTNRLGAYRVTAEACDNTSHCAKYTFEVQVIDRISPALELIGADPLILIAADVARIEELDPGVNTSDNYNDDLSDVVRTSYPDLTGADKGTIIYTVADSSGNTAFLDRQVIVHHEYKTPEPGPNLPLVGGSYKLEDNAGYLVMIGSTGGVWEWLSVPTAWLDLGEYLMLLAENAPADGRFLSVMLSEASQMVGRFEITLSSDRAAWTYDELGIIQFWRNLMGHALGGELSNPFHPQEEESEVIVARVLSEAVLSVLLGSCPYSLEVTPELVDGNMKVTQMRVRFNSTACSVEIEDIPAVAGRIGSYLAEIIEGLPMVSVAAYADLYGLVYRIEVRFDGNNTQSSVAYSHPGLIP